MSEDVFCGMDGDRETTEHHLAGFTGLTASLGRSFYRVMHLPEGEVGVRNIACWWFGTCFIFPYSGNNHPN